MFDLFGKCIKKLSSLAIFVFPYFSRIKEDFLLCAVFSKVGGGVENEYPCFFITLVKKVLGKMHMSQFCGACILQGFRKTNVEALASN
mmetsp:Transcript_17810/g.24532  ORF Transcript_17810/g.24532 Transcript_17810/m.24532 type:complete len:88 (+) Transcript_17810:76-339(+)